VSATSRASSGYGYPSPGCFTRSAASRSSRTGTSVGPTLAWLRTVIHLALTSLGVRCILPDLFDEDLIDHMFELVEGTRGHIDETLNYSLVKLLVRPLGLQTTRRERRAS
jgi:hypothetical protein